MRKFLLISSFLLLSNPVFGSEDKKTFTVYFAGDLFDQKHLTGNHILAERIEELSDGRYRCNLPQQFEGSMPTDRVEIRNISIRSIMKADAAIFNFDGVDLDSGTVVEFVIAKMLDVPALLLRTDFRTGGFEFGGDWNLMVDGFPRSVELAIPSIFMYSDLGMEGMHKSMAKSIIDGLDEAMNKKPLLTSLDDLLTAFLFVTRMCGSGMDELMTDELLNEIITRRMENVANEET